MEPAIYNRFQGALLYPSRALKTCTFYAGPAAKIKIAKHGEEEYFYDNMPTLEYTTCRPTAAGVTIRVLPKSVLRFLVHCKFNTAGHLIAMHPSMLVASLNAWNSATHKKAEPPQIPLNRLLHPGTKLPSDCPPIQTKDLASKFMKETLMTPCKSTIHIGEDVGPMADCLSYLPHPVCRACWKQIQRPSPKWVQCKRLPYLVNETCGVFPAKLQKFPLLYILRGMLIHGYRYGPHQSDSGAAASAEDAPPLLIVEYMQLGLKASMLPMLALLSLRVNVQACANALGPQTYYTWKALCRGRAPALTPESLANLLVYERSSIIQKNELPPAWSTHEDPQMFWHIDRVDATCNTVIHRDTVHALQKLVSNLDLRVVITFVAEDFKSSAPFLDCRYLQINAGAVKKAIAGTGQVMLCNAEVLSWALLNRLLETDVKKIVLRVNLTKLLKSQQSCCLDLLFIARAVDGMPSLGWVPILLDSQTSEVRGVSIWVSLLTTAHRPVDPKLVPFAEKEHRLLQAYFDLRTKRHIGLVRTATAFFELAAAEGYEVKAWLPYPNLVYFGSSVFTSHPPKRNGKRKAKEVSLRPASREKCGKHEDEQ